MSLTIAISVDSLPLSPHPNSLMQAVIESSSEPPLLTILFHDQGRDRVLTSLQQAMERKDWKVGICVVLPSLSPSQRSITITTPLQSHPITISNSLLQEIPKKVEVKKQFTTTRAGISTNYEQIPIPISISIVITITIMKQLASCVMSPTANAAPTRRWTRHFQIWML